MGPADRVQNRYRVLDGLGVGGMGTVYRVLDEETRQTLALKVVSKSVTHHPEVMEAFRQEFRLLTRLGHPNLVRVHDFGVTEDGAFFFTMDHVPGRDLYAATGSLSLEVALGLVVQVCRGLEYIHSRDLVHMDVKPSNVLVTPGPGPVESWGVKLMDFGLALDATARRPSRARGTLAYMAPEVVRAAVLDRRSDLYSLGVVLYEVVTREVPFQGDTSLSVIRKHLEEPPRPPRELNAQVPEGLQSLILALLEKDPARRPSSAHEVIREIDRLVGGRHALETQRTCEGYVARGAFVGRRPELEALQRRFAAVRSGGPGGLVLVGGEAGVGKSRLLQELRFHVQLEGGHYVAGRSTHRSHAPYQPFVEVLHQVLRLLGTEAAREVERAAPYLKGLLPAAGEGAALSGAPDPPPLDPAPARLRHLEELTRFLVGASRTSGLVVGLEDLHWADASTLELVAHLARALHRGRMLVCATWRTDGEELPAVASLEAALQREGLCESIRLEPLALDETSALVASMVGPLPRAEVLVARLQEATRGNPMQLVELMRSLVEEGLLVREVKGWTLGGDDPARLVLPEGPLRGLARLEGASREVVTALAVLGRPSTVPLLERVLGLGGEAAWDTVLRLQGRGLVAREPGIGREPLFDLRHGRTREWVYEDLGAAERAAWHRRAAEALEAHHAGRTTEVVDQLADHCYHAGLAGPALGYLEAAGGRARALYSNEEAIRCMTRALEVLDRMDRGPHDREARSRMHGVLGDLLSIVGRYDEALAHYHAVLQDGPTGDPLARVVRNVANAHHRKGEYRRALEVLDAWAGPLASAGPAGRARIQGQHGWLLMHTGDLARGIAACQEGLAMLEGAGETAETRAVALELHTSLGSLHLTAGDCGEAIRSYERCQAASAGEGDLANAHINLAHAHFKAGSAEESARHAGIGLGLMERMGNVSGVAMAVTHLGNTQLQLGLLDEALASYERARDLCERTGHQDGLGWAWNNMGAVHCYRGEQARALECWERSLAVRTPLGDRHALAASHTNLADGYRQSGEWARASEHLGRALALAEELGARDLLCLNIVARAAFLLDLGEPGEVPGLLRRARRLASEGSLAGQAAQVEEVAARDLRLRGEVDAARGPLDRALAAYEAMGDRAGTLSALHELGVLETQAGRHAEASRAIARLVAAAREGGQRLPLARGLLLRAELERLRGGAMEARQGALEEAARLLQGEEFPDLRWRLHLERARVLRDGALPAEAAREYARAMDLLRAVWERLPASARGRFLERADCAALQREGSELVQELGGESFSGPLPGGTRRRDGPPG
ncbi:MAG: protein kinase [Planctomycetes bacterium]|nr:protein kinase [Planctomycetota bacterium]